MKFPDYTEVVRFHGHSCPGLAAGYKLTIAALEKLKQLRAEDEEIVAIVENDACGTDAVQFVSGCTFGKGNLIFKDYGKMVYTFICRESGNAIRASRKAAFLQSLKKGDLSREELIEIILNSDTEDFTKLEQIQLEVPARARLQQNDVCDNCGETVMITRIVNTDDRKLCIPCAEKGSNKSGMS
jgi:formylmethanofuran dehydrogenase subunit E